MNHGETIRIADTRFSVRSDAADFMNWLEESTRYFTTDDEPDLIVNLRLNNVTNPDSKFSFLDVRSPGADKGAGEMDLDVTFDHPLEPYWPVLQICLRCVMAVKRPPDLLFHSSGVIYRDDAYLFSGESGAGKSTACKLLAGDPSITILHDDMVAISPDGRAWSTPLRGEVPGTCNIGAPLRAIFFLEQDIDNFTVEMSPRKAAGLLSQSLVPPLAAVNSRLVNQMQEALTYLFQLAENIPCYELHFRPEREFWDCVTGLAAGREPTPMLKGGIRK